LKINGKLPEFSPDYTNIRDAAYNRIPGRMPLYEHIVSDTIMEELSGKKFRHLYNGNMRDKIEYFKHYCGFFRDMGYDSVSFEGCIGLAMPHSGCLGAHRESVIHDYGDFEKYPWDGVPDAYFAMYGEYFEALRSAMPAGMKAVGGVGNGVFECVEDVVGYMNLCYISSDDPELYAALFRKMGDVSLAIWKRFMELYGGIYCVLRFGDDLGFKTSTLISPDDIRRHVIPQYARIIALVHSRNKPFLLHSCGSIFTVMPDIIREAKIDAKHSNEDEIAEFPVWVEKYGREIGNFGGLDTDTLCRRSRPGIRERTNEILGRCKKQGGIAFGSGNSIPDYVPADHYLEMVNTAREYRGDFS
jgi:uroporphyrinogen decarboxylase